MTKEANTALAFSIIADFLASVPTFVKSYREPESESAGAYALNALGGVILFTIRQWDFANTGFAVYLFLNCLILVSLITFKIGKKKY